MYFHTLLLGSIKFKLVNTIMKRVSPLGGGSSTFVELKLANTQDGAKIVQLQKSDIDLD
jgi:hypothetical protein